jgi:protein ImuB
MLWVALQALPERASAELADGCTALGWWALQFTPKVARVDDVLLLELSASERLWGGRSALLRHIYAADKPVTGVRCARGTTSLIALAQLQLLQSKGLSGRAQRRTAPDDLPLATLAAARPHLATLERIGCTCWGQLRTLPRGGVVRRFDADLLDALDRAYGQAPDSYPWLMLPEQFDATLELGAQVEAAPALLFGARRLFNQLQLWLQARHAGVLALLLGWTMDERRNTVSQGELLLRTAEPSADMAHLQRLLAEQLARITLPAPVLYLRLRSLETEKLRGETGSLLPQEQVDGDSLLQMQERLRARLGDAQVLQAQECTEHRPERMQLWHKLAQGTRQGKLARSDQSVLYPSWLLAKPLRLVVRDQCPHYPGPLTLLAGPQRFETAWWDGADCALRDYFLARSEQFGLLWIYRERLNSERAGAESDSSWYLHGLFA